MNGEAAFDYWSLVHVGTGVLLGVLRIPWWVVLLLLVGFELIEGNLRRFTTGEVSGLTEHESDANVLADIAAGMAGYVAGRLMK